MYTLFQTIPIGKGNKQKTFWNRVGVGFEPNKDGSINVKLDLFPGCTFQLRKNEEKEPGDVR
jgi:hypothetical protein